DTASTDRIRRQADHFPQGRHRPGRTDVPAVQGLFQHLSGHHASHHEADAVYIVTVVDPGSAGLGREVGWRAHDPPASLGPPGTPLVSCHLHVDQFHPRILQTGDHDVTAVQVAVDVAEPVQDIDALQNLSGNSQYPVNR